MYIYIYIHHSQAAVVTHGISMVFPCFRPFGWKNASCWYPKRGILFPQRNQTGTSYVPQHLVPARMDPQHPIILAISLSAIWVVEQNIEPCTQWCILEGSSFWEKTIWTPYPGPSWESPEVANPARPLLHWGYMIYFTDNLSVIFLATNLHFHFNVSTNKNDRQHRFQDGTAPLFAGHRTATLLPGASKTGAAEHVRSKGSWKLLPSCLRNDKWIKFSLNNLNDVDRDMI